MILEPENRDAGSATEWFTPGRFAFVLAACIFATHPEVVLGTRTFFFRDFGRFGYPLAFHHRESFWNGEIPLWNPLNNFGLPFLAQWNTLVLYPGSLLYLLLPLPWSVSMFCLAHQFWAGLGMYYLARHWTGSPVGAGLAGMAFAFNGLTVNCLMWPAIMAGLAWLPWTVFCVERGWKTGGHAVFGGAVVAAMQMLAGAPEIVIFTWVILTVLLITYLFSNCSGRSGPVLRFGGMALLVAGLASIQLLPFLDLLTHSQRDPEYGSSEWSIPRTGWANFLVPLLHCHRTASGVFFQSDQFWTSSYYAGVATLALALLAACQVRTLMVRILAALALAGVVLALGDNGYLYKWLRTLVPLLGFVRFPVKFVFLTIFCLPLLTAYGFAWWRTRQGTELERAKNLFARIGIVVLGLMAVVLWLAYRYPFPFDQWDAMWKNALARALFFTLFLRFAFFKTRTTILRQLVGVALVFTLCIDLLIHAPQQNPTIPPAAYEPGLVRLSPQPSIGVSRVLISSHSLLKFQFGAVTNQLNDYLGSRLSLGSDCNLLDGIPKVDGSFPLYLREAMDLSYLYYPRPVGDLSRLTDFLNVSHATAPGRLFEWEFRTNFLPFVTAGQEPLFLDKIQTLKGLCTRDFAPQRIVYLPLEAKSFVQVGPGNTEVRTSHFSNHRGDIEVIAPAKSLVVISQAYYHQWRAYVDDRPTGIWRANHAFQAIEVPPGTHHIQLIYQDTFFYLGTALSLLALTACAIGALRSRH